MDLIKQKSVEGFAATAPNLKVPHRPCFGARATSKLENSKL